MERPRKRDTFVRDLADSNKRLRTLTLGYDFIQPMTWDVNNIKPNEF
jgi:hypothetical protein